MMLTFMLILLITTLTIGRSTALFIILLLPILFYDLFFEYFYNGQSIGKKIASIKVVKLDGTPSAFGNYLIRWIFRIIDNLIFFGSVTVFMLMFNNKGQRLGDLAAGTTVIKLSKRKLLLENLSVKIPIDYSHTYPEVKLLSEKDIKTIKEVLKYYNTNGYSETNNEITERTKLALEKKMHIKSNQPPLLFFQTILMDYSYFNQ